MRLRISSSSKLAIRTLPFSWMIDNSVMRQQGVGSRQNFGSDCSSQRGAGAEGEELLSNLDAGLDLVAGLDPLLQIFTFIQVGQFDDGYLMRVLARFLVTSLTQSYPATSWSGTNTQSLPLKYR